MNSALRTGGLAAAALLGIAASACGPTVVNFDPSNAAKIIVRPAAGRNVFCPGQRFKVELLAELKNGSTCSSTDRTRGCQGQEDAVLNNKMVRIEGGPGRFVGDREDFTWEPPADLFATADTGIRLKGWLQGEVGGKLQESVIGESLLVPVYGCRSEETYHGGTAGAGAHGGPGPNLDVSIAPLKTPFYPDAAIVRVDSPFGTDYYISAGPADRIRIVSRGAGGGAGTPGADGKAGESGRSGSGQCANGENGRDGTDGGPGGPGGDGGPGGQIRVHVDKSHAAELRDRLLLESVGGPGGAGGPGGDPGAGGPGGSAGPSGQGCSGQRGQDGRAGRRGSDGQAGRHGPNGPEPVVTTSTRDALFGAEMPLLQRIEAAKHPDEAAR